MSTKLPLNSKKPVNSVSKFIFEENIKAFTSLLKTDLREEVQVIVKELLRNEKKRLAEISIKK